MKQILKPCILLALSVVAALTTVVHAATMSIGPNPSGDANHYMTVTATAQAQLTTDGKANLIVSLRGVVTNRGDQTGSVSASMGVIAYFIDSAGANIGSQAYGYSSTVAKASTSKGEVVTGVGAGSSGAITIPSGTVAVRFTLSASSSTSTSYPITGGVNTATADLVGYRTITLTFTAPVACYVGLKSSIGEISDLRPVAAGETYSTTARIRSDDTATYSLAIVDLAASYLQGNVVASSTLDGASWWSGMVSTPASPADPVGYADATDGLVAASTAVAPGATNDTLAGGAVPQNPPTAAQQAAGAVTGGAVAAPGTNDKNDASNPTSTNALTNTVYTQGVQSVIDAVNTGSAGIKTTIANSGGSGGGGTDTAVKNAVDGVTAKLQAIRDEQVAAEEAAATAAEEKKDEGVTAGASAGSAAQSLVSGYQVGSVASAPSAGNWIEACVVQMPAKFGGRQIDLRPLINTYLLPILHAFRTALSVLVLVKLAQSLWNDMGEWVRGFSTVRQAHGNALAAGTGAQATALTAAGLITVAVTVALTSMLGWYYGDISFELLRNVSASHPFAEFPTLIYGMLQDVFPIQLIWTALLAKMSFGIYAASLFAACMTVIRYIIP